MNLECLLQGYGIEKMATNQFLQKEAARVRGKSPRRPISQEEADEQDALGLAMEPEESSTWGNLLPYLLGAGALGVGGYGAYQYLPQINEYFKTLGKTPEQLKQYLAAKQKTEQLKQQAQNPYSWESIKNLFSQPKQPK